MRFGAINAVDTAMRFRREIKNKFDGLKAHPTMMNKKLLRVSLFPAIFLLMMLIFTPTTESFAAGRKQVVILDLSDLEWSQISANHPNLLNLLETGSAGLVRLPATSKNWPPNLPVFKESYPKRRIEFYEDLVSRIDAKTDFNNTLLLVYTRSSEEIDPRLTPILLKGSGFNGGVLYSPSTRKHGIVTYSDVRSTIFRFVNPGKTETVFQVRPKPGDWRKLVQSRTNLQKNYAIRWPLLTGYFYLFLGVILLLIISFSFRLKREIINGLAWGYLLLLTAPATFLLEALIDPVEWAPILFWTFGISGVLFLWSYLGSGKDLTRALLMISFLTAGLAAVNGLTNGYFECKSFLGYSVVTGARYYGIGNEYMGILLGASLVGLSLSFNGLKHRGGLVWFAPFLLGLVLIHPNFGADVGGGITALMGLGITNYLWLKQPIRTREMIRLGLMTLTALVLAGVWDLYANRDSMSHLGQLLLAIGDHGPMVLNSMVIRKLSLNLRLISSTPLTLVLIGILLAIPLSYRFPLAPLRRMMEKHPEAVAGLTGLAVTALIGFLVNDSGIVSAAMIFMFGIGLALTVALQELGGIKIKKDQKS